MRKDSFFVIADNIRSLENIGSLFRTSDAFGVEKIFLCGISGTPPHDKISKTALGAESWIPWEYHSQAWRVVEKLHKEGVYVAALEQGKSSVSLEEFSPQFPFALVVGNEVQGVSRPVLQRVDGVIEIPMRGKKESLNVAVAFGVAAYAMRTM